MSDFRFYWVIAQLLNCQLPFCLQFDCVKFMPCHLQGTKMTYVVYMPSNPNSKVHGHFILFKAWYGRMWRWSGRSFLWDMQLLAGLLSVCGLHTPTNFRFEFGQWHELMFPPRPMQLVNLHRNDPKSAASFLYNKLTVDQNYISSCNLFYDVMSWYLIVPERTWQQTVE